MRSSLDETFAGIREKNSMVLNGSEGVIRDKVHDDDEDEDDDKKKKKKKKKKGMVVEEEDPDWPMDAEIGASENWKALKELEKAAKVYWSAKDQMPPRVWYIAITTLV
ncbi:hypothetical protein R6Q59_001609 [Mikania micrantha]